MPRGLRLCYTQRNDSDFHMGGTAIVAIKQFGHKRQPIYGRIPARQ